MDEKEQFGKRQAARRSFLGCLGTCGCRWRRRGSDGRRVAQGNAGGGARMRRPVPAIPGYDWSKHHWAFGVDATKCIGCLRCVEACKAENDVAPDAHHFRTWVERYVYLDGEDKAHIDSQADPVNIAGLRFRRKISIRQPL